MRQAEFSFFNTVPISGEELIAAEQKARYQDDRVLKIFGELYASTPSKVWGRYCKEYNHCPLTSIRRSITNLTKQGKLIQTGNIYKGIYGRHENEWKIK